MNSKTLFKNLDNLFIGLLSFLLFLGITFYFLVRNGISISIALQPQNVSMLAILIVSFAVIIIKILPPKIFGKEPSKTEALLKYKKLSWIRLLIITFTDIAIILLFSVSLNYLLLVIYFILIALMFAYRPLEKNFKKEFENYMKGIK